MLLIDGRQAQSPFIVPMMLSNGSDLVARLTQRIESALPNPPSVAALAQEFAMSTRTLSRHVQAATGKSTLALLQSVRLNRARMLIETSRMTIEQVAEHVQSAHFPLDRLDLNLAVGLTQPVAVGVDALLAGLACAPHLVAFRHAGADSSHAAGFA
ncbi:helix-turn-helix domain-containing protein [Pseudomonas sp.]|uniref:helix-turn-helix domain-containing protein n=1 Tax=Pseudomonas sp. TaxID=306 RepID=UPI003F94C7B4